MVFSQPLRRGTSLLGRVALVLALTTLGACSDPDDTATTDPQPAPTQASGAGDEPIEVPSPTGVPTSQTLPPEVAPNRTPTAPEGVKTPRPGDSTVDPDLAPSNAPTDPATPVQTDPALFAGSSVLRAARDLGDAVVSKFPRVAPKELRVSGDRVSASDGTMVATLPTGVEFGYYKAARTESPSAPSDVFVLCVYSDQGSAVYISSNRENPVTQSDDRGCEAQRP